MSTENLKNSWHNLYRTAPEQLEKMSQANGLVSAFNANIDAVIKVSGENIQKLIEDHQISKENVLLTGERCIQKAEDARYSDEQRWLKAYRNYRGIYGSDTAFSSKEKSRVFVKITKVTNTAMNPV